MSFDVTDCVIFEPSPFLAEWFFHKMRGPVLRYKVALRIESYDICCVNSLFPCRSFTYVVIFRSLLKHRLFEKELVISDDGYPPDYNCRSVDDTNFSIDSVMHSSSIRAHHENVNDVFKIFNVLKTRFRQD